MIVNSSTPFKLGIYIIFVQPAIKNTKKKKSPKNKKEKIFKDDYSRS